mmetsp:Transcript_71324/g.183863  ORF Transcript_71324/g.183863 Transcript_71324/m.183863 type:complete len:87 (-) Transcript_71324:176-436(-)
MGWFPKGLKVNQMKDPGRTGNFEICVNGKLVHSKKTRNEGFFEAATKDQQEAVKKAIEEAVGADGTTEATVVAGSDTAGGGGCTVM